MNMTEIWPRKTRELRNHHFDSSIWNEFSFRGDASAPPLPTA